MKHIFFIIGLFSLCCDAQSPIITLSGNNDYATINGAYYKDTNNELDAFVGTWIYTNGTTSLTITLQKKVMQQINDSNGFSFYTDKLIGEYKYIENNIEKINTLSQLSVNLSNINNYNIVGNTIIRHGNFLCQDCATNDRKILLQFNEPNRDILGYDPEMIFQRVDSDGLQKLRLRFRTTSGMIVEEGVTPPCTEYKIPFGTYIIIKQKQKAPSVKMRLSFLYSYDTYTTP